MEIIRELFGDRALKRRKAKDIDDELQAPNQFPEPDRYIFRPPPHLEWLVSFINRKIRDVRSDTAIYVGNVPQLSDPIWLSVNENPPRRSEMFISLEQNGVNGYPIRRKRLATVSVQDTSPIHESVLTAASCAEWLERFINDGSATGLDHLLIHLKEGDGWFYKWAQEFEEAAQERNRASMGIGAEKPNS